MEQAHLEHINFTVPNPNRTADLLCKLFGWKIRWKGEALDRGFTVHVGTSREYIALYRPKEGSELRPFQRNRTGHEIGGLNHIALVVDDLEATERRILKAGFKTSSHGDYEPGRRFYFLDDDGLEYEVVSYARPMSPMEGACFTK
ncbi:MAG: VOC family protein [Pseudomonadota bacterium]